MTKHQKISKFQRGTAVYVCRMCNKRTRPSGFTMDAANCRLCEDCYDRAGWANTHGDGHCYAGPDRHAAGECPFCDLEKANAEQLAETILAAATALTDADNDGIPIVVRTRDDQNGRRGFASYWAPWNKNEASPGPMAILVTDRNVMDLVNDTARDWTALRDKYPTLVKVDAQSLQ